MFAEVIPASPSAKQEGSKARPTRATSGRKCAESFEKHAPAGSLPRTFAAMLASVSTPLPHNWKLTASPSGRLLFQLQPSVPRTGGTDSGLWPTPVAQDDNKTPEAHLRMKARMPGGERTQITSLNVMVKAVERGMWPTPTVRGNYNRAGASAKSGDGLATAVKMWPTPSASDAGGSRTVPVGTAATGKRPDGKKAQIGLNTAVRFWPTPMSCTGNGGAHGLDGGSGARAMLRKNTTEAEARQMGSCQLNPGWVEALMGYPPGWTSLSDGPTEAGKLASPGLPLVSPTGCSD